MTQMTDCAFATPYGNRDLGQHQAITWSTVGLSARSSNIYLRAISRDTPTTTIISNYIQLSHGPMS